MLVRLAAGSHEQIIIKPRWPSRSVSLDARVLNKLISVVHVLPTDLKLILTRGYESPHGVVGRIRTVLRFVGRSLFLVIYPKRHREIPEIFSANGHDQDGTHVDLGVMLNGQQLTMLPYGVFTSPRIVEKHERDFAEILHTLKGRLHAVQGAFHANRLEALQMHVDFNLEGGDFSRRR